MRFKANVPRYDVTVRASPAALPLVRKSSAYQRAQQLTSAASGAASGTADRSAAAQSEHWSTVILQFEVEEEAVPYVLRFGGELEVVTPATLRRTVASLAAGAAARHGAG